MISVMIYEFLIVMNIIGNTFYYVCMFNYVNNNLTIILAEQYRKCK